MKAKNLTQWLCTFKGTKVNIFLHTNDFVKGILLDVKEDHVVIDSNNNIFYIVIHQIRAISKSTKYSDIEHKMVHYIDRAYISGVLFSLKNNWITINGLGGCPFNGILSEITDDHINLINGEELLCIHKSWILNLNKGSFCNKDLPNNANTGKVARCTPVATNPSLENKSVLLGDKVQNHDKENEVQNDTQNGSLQDPNDYYTFPLNQKINNNSMKKNDFTVEHKYEMKEEYGSSESGDHHSIFGAGEAEEFLAMNKTQEDVREKSIQNSRLYLNESYAEQSGSMQVDVQSNQQTRQINQDHIQEENHHSFKNPEQKNHIENGFLEEMEVKYLPKHEQFNQEEISSHLESSASSDGGEDSGDHQITLAAKKNEYTMESEVDQDSQAREESLCSQSDYNFEEIMYIYPDLEVENETKRHFSFDMIHQGGQRDHDLKQIDQHGSLHTCMKSKSSKGLSGGDECFREHKNKKKQFNQGRSSIPKLNNQVSSKEDKNMLLKQYHALMKHAEKMYKKLSEGE